MDLLHFLSFMTMPPDELTVQFLILVSNNDEGDPSQLLREISNDLGRKSTIF